MADIPRQPSEQGLSRRGHAEARPHSWLVGLDYLFYILVAVAIFALFYYLYSYKQLLWLYLPVFLQGTLITLVISIISAIFAIIFGFIGAMGRLSRFPVIRWIATAYVEVIRGTPVLVQLLLWYYGVGFVLSNIGFDPYIVWCRMLSMVTSMALLASALTMGHT